MGIMGIMDNPGDLLGPVRCVALDRHLGTYGIMTVWSWSCDQV